MGRNANMLTVLKIFFIKTQKAINVFLDSNCKLKAVCVLI